MWPDRRLAELLKIEHPIILAPMAGAMDVELAAEVSAAGGLGSLPCAMLTPDMMRDQITKFRARTDRPVNVNFFCHKVPVLDNAREVHWRDRLKPYYQELGVDPSARVPSSNRAPFDAAFCEAIEELKSSVFISVCLPTTCWRASRRPAASSSVRPPHRRRRLGSNAVVSMPSSPRVTKLVAIAGRF